jgi:hypothetical protein
MPNMYARGILFGKMILELGDMCSGKNEKLGMFADVEFKTKVLSPRVESGIIFTNNDLHKGLLLWYL